MDYKTEQENFWAGNFGDEYSQRNSSEQLLKSKKNLFKKMLSTTGNIQSVIEFGSNIGLNLKSICSLSPETELSAIEINGFAKSQLESWGGCKEIFHQSALEFEAKTTYELSMILGVLIHINPKELPIMYEKLYSSTNRWIFISESYNPTPLEVSYRGHESRYFKRDFAGEMLDMYQDLKLVEYGFVYHRDPLYPLDDTTWFLLEKQGSAK